MIVECKNMYVFSSVGVLQHVADMYVYMQVHEMWSENAHA
jgi:hypothetical protein